ncbi:MAG: hypothetical protein OXO54_06000 [Chloroflexota bacterium]|nr:hypothetical protein [Chloroflexota bacterium]MDE2897855.1 hypothetical protein [Chloroflexota bacterium]
MVLQEVSLDKDQDAAAEVPLVAVADMEDMAPLVELVELVAEQCLELLQLKRY